MGKSTNEIRRARAIADAFENAAQFDPTQTVVALTPENWRLAARFVRLGADSIQDRADGPNIPQPAPMRRGGVGAGGDMALIVTLWILGVLLLSGVIHG